jgi:hypothetical protein
LNAREWAGRDSLDRWAILLVVAAHLSFFPYFPSMQSANELSRLFLAESLVVEHDVSLDWAFWQYGSVADVSRVADSWFSDKPPATAFLAAPVLAIRHLVDGGPDPEADLHLARLWVGVLPTLLLLLLMRREMAGLGVTAPTRALALAAYGLGTLAFPYTILLYGHQLVAVLVYGTWYLVRRAPIGPARAALAGALGAFCLATEYQSALYLLPLVAVAVGRARPRGRVLLAGAAGAAPVLALLGLYHDAAFGSPLRTGYNFIHNPFFAAIHKRGLMGVDGPSWAAFKGSLLLPSKGLLPWSPFLLLGFAGLPAWTRRVRALGIDAADGEPLLRLAMIGAPIAFVSSMAYWDGGWTVGQRHLTPLVPFLVAPAAALLESSAVARLFGPGLAASSVAMTGTATIVVPHLAEYLGNPWFDLTLPLLRHGCVAASWTEPALGATGLAAALAAGFVLLCVGTIAAWPDRPWRQAVTAALLVLLPLGIGAAASRVDRAQPTSAQHHFEEYRDLCRVAGRWEGLTERARPDESVWDHPRAEPDPAPPEAHPEPRAGAPGANPAGPRKDDKGMRQHAPPPGRDPPPRSPPASARPVR